MAIRIKARSSKIQVFVHPRLNSNPNNLSKASRRRLSSPNLSQYGQKFSEILNEFLSLNIAFLFSYFKKVSKIAVHVGKVCSTSRIFFFDAGLLMSLRSKEVFEEGFLVLTYF